MTRMMIAVGLLTTLLAGAGAAPSGNGQARFDSYFDVLPYFWGELYGEGGETLYCGERFGSRMC